MFIRREGFFQFSFCILTSELIYMFDMREEGKKGKKGKGKMWFGKGLAGLGHPTGDYDDEGGEPSSANQVGTDKDGKPLHPLKPNPGLSVLAPLVNLEHFEVSSPIDACPRDVKVVEN